MQVATSTDLVHWEPFEPIIISGHDVLAASSGDLYFFSVHANPVHSGSLIAQFPLVQHARGCIGLALSIDGVQWSRVTPLVRCSQHCRVHFYSL